MRKFLLAAIIALSAALGLLAARGLEHGCQSATITSEDAPTPGGLP